MTGRSSFVAFADPSEKERNLAVELVLALADHCQRDDFEVGLLCDPLTALEVGVGILGSNEGRTVEGGERRPSAVRLLALIRRPDVAPAERLDVAEEGEDVGGGLEELYDLGVFEAGEEKEGRVPRDEPSPALYRAVTQAPPEYVLGLGAESRLWAVLHEASLAARERRPKLLVAPGLTYPERLPDLQRLELRVREGARVLRERGFAKEVDEEFLRAEQEAMRTAETVAALLEWLATHDEEGERPLFR